MIGLLRLGNSRSSRSSPSSSRWPSYGGPRALLWLNVIVHLPKEKTTDGRLLDEKRREIDARLKELRPLVEEYERLEAAAAALAGVSASSPPASRPLRAQARANPKRKSVGPSTRGRRGRPKGSGKRAEEALALVTAQPGITIPEIAERMGIKHNYLYRVLPGLASDGRVKKDGRGRHPVETA